ncbi:MAG TPA: hypothetical protein ENJ82_13610 [Bacteroidetes bacterium]|nr:hypothetical protein [Bacteroidota bacterium]
MKAVFGAVLGILLLATGCGEMGTYKEPVKTVAVEFINPTADTLYGKVWAEEGWVNNVAVAPFSSVIEQVEEGLFSVGAVSTTGDLLRYYPSGMDAETLKDTVNFGITLDADDGGKTVRIRFRNRLFHNLYTARYAFDLSFDKSHIFAVADLQWMFGAESEKSMREEFLRVTEGGKKFILSLPHGDNAMIFPEHTTGPFDPIPEAMTVKYNIKSIMPKIYLLPDSVEASQSANYLVKKLILD